MTAPHIPPPGLKGKILVIDDELDIREGLYDLLTLEGGYLVELAHNGTEGLHKLDGASYDLVLLDLMMPDMSGMDVLRRVRKTDGETPIFMITAYGSVEAAVDALKLGANDYFSKPWDNEKLIIEIDRMIARRLLEYENTHLKRALKQRYSFPNIIGKSERMVRLLDLVGQVAPSRSTILITGETGTGKELVARAVHRMSPRRDLPFISLNCAAIPTGLLESELFGYEKGAFTGALSQKIGRFEMAHRGTLFLDEVGDIPLDLQPKLLRALQEKSFERLGGTKTIPIDVRLVAATNRNLTQMMGDKLFRSDLYYRLKVFPITTPPLRDRAEDIPILVRHFTKKYAAKMGRQIEKIPADTMSALVAWRWPGNIRELENFIERAVILTSGTTLRAPLAEIREDAAESAGGDTLEQVEREHIVRVLRESGGVVTAAATRLGLHRTTLNAMMRKLGISRGDF